MDTEMILLLITRKKSEVKLIIFPLCIFPLIRDTINQIATRATKNERCDGIYPLKLPGLVHTIARKDSVRITISANIEMILNFLLSISTLHYISFPVVKKVFFYENSILRLINMTYSCIEGSGTFPLVFRIYCFLLSLPSF